MGAVGGNLADGVAPRPGDSSTCSKGFLSGTDLFSLIAKSSTQWVAEQARLSQQHARAREIIGTSLQLVDALSLDPRTAQSVVALRLNSSSKSAEADVTTKDAKKWLREYQFRGIVEGEYQCTVADVTSTTTETRGSGRFLEGFKSTRGEDHVEVSVLQDGHVKKQRLDLSASSEDPALYCVAAGGLSASSAESVAEVVRIVQPRAVILVLAPYEHHILGLIHSCSHGTLGVPPPMALLKSLGTPQPHAPGHPERQASADRAQVEDSPNQLGANHAAACQQGCREAEPHVSRSSAPPLVPMQWSGMEPGPILTSSGAVVAYAAQHRVPSPALFHLWSALHFLSTLAGAHPLSHLAAAAREAQELGVPVLAVPALDDKSILQSYGYGWHGTGSGSSVGKREAPVQYPGVACECNREQRGKATGSPDLQSKGSGLPPTSRVQHALPMMSASSALHYRSAATAALSSRESVAFDQRSTLVNATDLASAQDHPLSPTVPQSFPAQEGLVEEASSAPSCPPGTLAQEIAGQIMSLLEGESGHDHQDRHSPHALSPGATVGARARGHARALLETVLGLEGDGGVVEAEEACLDALLEYRAAADAAREKDLQGLKEGWVPEAGGGIGGILLRAACSWTGLTPDRGREGEGTTVSSAHSPTQAGHGDRNTGGMGLLAAGLQGLLLDGIPRLSSDSGVGDQVAELRSHQLYPSSHPANSQGGDATSAGARGGGEVGGPLVVVMSAATLNRVGREWCRGDPSETHQLEARSMLLSAAVPVVPACPRGLSRDGQGGPECHGRAKQVRAWLQGVPHQVQKLLTWGLAQLAPLRNEVPAKDTALCSLSATSVPTPRMLLPSPWHQNSREWTPQPHGPLVLVEEGVVLALSALTTLVVAVGGKAATWTSAAWVVKLGTAKAASSVRLGFTVLRSWPHALMATKGLLASSGPSSPALLPSVFSKLLALSPVKSKGALAYALSKGGAIKGASFKGGVVSKAGGVWSVKSGVATSSTGAAASSSVAGATSASASASSASASAAAAASSVAPVAGSTAGSAVCASSSSASLGSSSAASAAGGWVRQSAQHKAQQVLWRMLGTLLDQRMRSSLAAPSHSPLPPRVASTPARPVSLLWGVFPGLRNATHQQQEGERLRALGRVGIVVGGGVIGGGYLWGVVEGAGPAHPWLGQAHCALSVAPSAKEVARLGRGVQSLRTWGAEGTKAS